MEFDGRKVSFNINDGMNMPNEEQYAFTVPISMGGTKFGKTMLDLGASINVMPEFVYRELKLGPLSTAYISIQLADRSCVLLIGIVQDVLVDVEQLTFPADFYLLSMERENGAAPILLGRPFMKTAKEQINVDKW